ncbi:hypothetical protein [Streptomyces fructofermentans]|uniref:hypothetical protein n=1 Tax=Streptomyces fructofermentans TaxID=152141 RepID=UPI00340732AC
MIRTRLTQRLSVVAATISFVGVAAMQPASAYTSYMESGPVQVQVDTTPLNHAPGWVWVYSSDRYVDGVAEIQYEGGYKELRTWGGSATAYNTPGKIRAVRLCVEDDGRYCLDWQWF